MRADHCGANGMGLKWGMPTLLAGVVLLASCSSSSKHAATNIVGEGGAGATDQAAATNGGGAGEVVGADSDAASSGGTASTASTGSGTSESGCAEGTTRSCAAAPLNRLGVCALDTAVCEGGQWVGCPESKGDDVCEPGNDNNCNGVPNEGCSCVNDTVQPCGHPEVGVCKLGTSTCGNSEWGSCLGNIDPGPRDCSSADDNDCDGSPDNTVDEACQCEVGTTRPCDEHPDLDDKGRCRAGTQTCILSADGTSADWSECMGSVGPSSADTCDPGNDDNCNGVLNEGCPCVTGDTQACGHAAVGICKPGVSTCSDSQWGACVGNVEPKLRDCSSSLDNDCDGKADNTTDSVCQCLVGDTQDCDTHPGKDGNGPCKAGSQGCILAADKASSYWGSCSGSVGPAGSDTCSPDNDNNCNGTPNEGCSCVNGTQMDCACGDSVTCTNGTMPACAQTPVLRYRDADNDGFGNPNNSNEVCPADLGWVSNANDCDDNDPNLYAGVNVCLSDQVTRQSCSSSGGVSSTELCSNGCLNGTCRSDGTIGVPGIITCDNTRRCDSSEGCNYNASYCGGGDEDPNYTWYCDAASDCPSGQKCWHFSFMGINHTVCSESRPSTSYKEVCDPLTATTCNCGEEMQTAGGGHIYRCLSM